MRKVRFILIAIAASGILGGTLAFKASKRGAIDYFTTDQFNAVAPASNVVFAAGVRSGTGTRVYWTIVAGAQAPNFNIVVANN
ncbi:hypothetical protein [Chitinophaga sp. LS1]|uniref:hypothetical protein n=1 Tax=Chitinophaga sp. LS1 TaxID=3051176 RepID=UPI002AABF638|nr:hypothetical protein [Chitinophaga sp. LS1]WPV67852.1 hypothetical protein QQL36_03830 [Chitinophaga sp. LS1]